MGDETFDIPTRKQIKMNIWLCMSISFLSPGLTWVGFWYCHSEILHNSNISKQVQKVKDSKVQVAEDRFCLSGMFFEEQGSQILYKRCPTDHMGKYTEVGSLHLGERLFYHWTRDRVPECVPSPPSWLCRSSLTTQSRGECSSVMAFAHAPFRVKVFCRHFCNQSLLYPHLYFPPWVSKNDLCLFSNSSFTCLGQYLLLYGLQLAPIFCHFCDRDWHFLLCAKKRTKLAAPATCFFISFKQIAGHRLIHPVFKEKC